MFKTTTEAINYLKSLNGIIMPVDFTYFNHCTSYLLPPSAQKSTKKIWEDFPKDGFVIYREMSFTERDVRIISALEHGGADKASIRYSAPSQPHLPFIIRVIMPKRHNNLNLSEANQKELDIIYSGYGDNRHPKLPNGTSIFMFACSNFDEVSGKEVDILYGIRSKDVIMYANKVYEEMQKQDIYPYAQMPEVEEIDVVEKMGNTNIVTTRKAFITDFEFNHHTYTIPKNKNFYRYERHPIVDEDGNIQAIMESDFEAELRSKSK